MGVGYGTVLWPGRNPAITVMKPLKLPAGAGSQPELTGGTYAIPKCLHSIAERQIHPRSKMFSMRAGAYLWGP